MVNFFCEGEVRYKMWKWKETKDLITAKTVLQYKTLKTNKGIINAYESKAKVQTTTKYNVMLKLEQVTKSVVQEQAKGKWQ